MTIDIKAERKAFAEAYSAIELRQAGRHGGDLGAARYGWMLAKRAALTAPQEPYDTSMVAIARRNLASYLSKAGFACSVDRDAAFNCLAVLIAAPPPPAAPVLSDELTALPQSLINLIGEYGMARADGLSDIERVHLWQLLIAGIKDYGRALLAKVRT